MKSHRFHRQWKSTLTIIFPGTLKSRHKHKFHQRSYSVQQEGSALSSSIPTKVRGRSVSEVTGGSTEDTTPTTTAAIDINVIQATPNLSPSCSLRSFSVESTSTPSAEAIITAIENEATLQQTALTK